MWPLEVAGKVKRQKDDQDDVHNRLDDKLLHEDAALLLGEALHLAKGIPANGRIELANQSKEANQRENGRENDDANEEDFALALRFLGKSAALHNLSAGRFDQFSFRGSQDASGLVSGKCPGLGVLGLGRRRLDAETFGSQSCGGSKVSKARCSRIRPQKGSRSKRAQDSRRRGGRIVDEIKLDCNRYY